MKIKPRLDGEEYVYELPATTTDVFVEGFDPWHEFSRQGSALRVNRKAPGANHWRFTVSAGGAIVTPVPPLRFRRRHDEYVTIATAAGVRMHT